VTVFLRLTPFVMAFLRDRRRWLLDEVQTTLRSRRDLVTRAEREELRVRMHPRDLAVHERFLHLLENPLCHARGIQPHERER